MRKFIFYVVIIIILTTQSFASELKYEEISGIYDAIDWTVESIRPYIQPQLGISAESAILIEAENGRVLYEKNAYERRGMASTTKIMTALLAIESGMMSDDVVVSSRAANTEGSSVYLEVNEVLTLENLVYALMLNSGNDAAMAIAEHVGGTIESFVDMMNLRAAELLLNNTSFANPSGLDAVGHYTTAADFADLTRIALKNSDFRKIVSTKKFSIPYLQNENGRILRNHNKLLKLYEGCIGVKTGFTRKSGRCLVSAAERNGVTLIAVTFKASDDWNDHIKMFDYGFSILQNTVIAPPNSLEYYIDVAGGIKNKIRAVNMEEISSVIFPGDAERVEIIVKAPHFLFAPIFAGETIGSIEFFIDGKKIAETPLTAAESIYEAVDDRNIFAKIGDIIKSLFGKN